MDTQESDDRTNDDDDLTDHIDGATYRERAASKLDQFARKTRQTLVEADIDVGVFFLISSSRNSVLIFGTPGDPDDDLWRRVRDVVGSVLRDLIGLERTRCPPVTCAGTDSIVDQSSQPTVQPTGQSGRCLMLMHSPALQHAGADR
jgi:hypothetical protein